MILLLYTQCIMHIAQPDNCTCRSSSFNRCCYLQIWVLMWFNIVINCLFKSLCSVQVAGRMRHGQMVGLQSLVTVNAQPSLSTRSSWQRQAVKFSHVGWRIMAVLTSCPKCRMVGSYQPHSAVEDKPLCPISPISQSHSGSLLGRRWLAMWPWQWIWAGDGDLFTSEYVTWQSH